jgi:hypothetical protein
LALNILGTDMTINDTLIVVLPIVTAIMSSYLTYYFATKSTKNEAMIKFKEEKYSNLVIALQGFVGSAVSSEKKVKFYEEQYKSWLYSSDNVVKAVNDLTNLLIEEKGKAPDPEKGRRVIGNIILEMRKDLIGKTNLRYKDFRYTDVIK